MKHSVNILIFPAGAENALELYRSLRYAPRFKVFGASSVEDHSAFVYEPENCIYGLPYIQSPDFLEAFNAVLHEHNIHMVFPTHDDVSLFLLENKESIDALVVGSSVSTALICRDKRLLYNRFKNFSFCPICFEQKEESIFPLFAKPARGQGGQGCSIVNSDQEVSAVLQDPAMLLCEYLPGNEYTVDCFTSKNGALLFAGMRSRDVVKMGISFVSRSVPMTEECRLIAETLNTELDFRGLWFFQVKQDTHGRLKLLEVSTRIAGTMGLYRQLGVNFAQLSAYDALNMDVSVLVQPLNVTLSRCLQSIYKLQIHYDVVYMDYDDTLVCNDKINILAIQFLYQCKNSSKKIILLTKHEGDLNESLKNLNLCSGLFDEIIHLTPRETKVDKIIYKNAILVDNLFSERKDAYEKKGIYVFDVDALECLLDY